MTAFSLPIVEWLPRRLLVTPIPWSRLRSAARWRRLLTWGLGLLWLLDAALQFQPFMFSTAFPDQVIAPTGQGSPVWVSVPVSWAAQLMAAHIVVFNALFASVQLVIAVGLFTPRYVRLALAGSVVWSMLVWWLGEGLGGTLAGPVSPLMGLPGAVVLYAVVALAVWPPRPRPQPDRHEAGSVATGGLLGQTGARVVWLLLWASFAFEAARPAARTPSGLHDLIAGMSSGEPAWIAAINVDVARALGHDGTQYSIGLAVICALIGISVVAPRALRFGVAAAVVLALALWVIGEDFGAIATGTGTDPNSGLPLALLALCYWPRHTARPPAPASRTGTARSGNTAAVHRTPARVSRCDV
jgi:hypothetical protein